MSCPAAMRVRAVLAPAGHPAEHQLGVAGEALVGPDAEPLHHARAEALDQRVGVLDEVEQRRRAVGVLEVDGDVAPAAQRDVAVRRVGRRAAHRLGALDADHLGAHVGQQHRRERAGADAGDLDDPIAGEWSGHAAIRSTTHRRAVSRRRQPAACRGVRRDRVDDHRPQRLGQVVAHVGEEQQVGAGDQLGRAHPAARRDQRVVAAVDDERRDVERGERVGAVAAGVDRRQLARRTLGVERAVERRPRRAWRASAVVAVVLRLPDHRSAADASM